MPPRKERIKRTCECCGAEFELLECQTKGGRGHYCSRACQGKAKIAHLNATRNPAVYNPSWFKSENVRGENNPKWKPPVQLVCIHCHQPFERKQWQLNGSGRTGDFCSKTCRDEYRQTVTIGEQSPLWKGGAKTYRGRNWRAIRLKIVEAQAGNCADCGRHIGTSLPVHHIKPFRQFQTAEEANSIENLIGLCQSCHMKLEMPQQWVERRQTSGR